MLRHSRNSISRIAGRGPWAICFSAGARSGPFETGTSFDHEQRQSNPPVVLFSPTQANSANDAL